MAIKYTDINELIAAYKKNKTSILSSEKYTSAVTEGQRPNVMFIACCDSRLDPALIFKLELGDIFTLRSIANIVPAYDEKQSLCSTSAAIEFVAANTGITDIVILGHSKCAGVAAMCNTNHDHSSHLSNWVHTNKVSKQLAAYPKDITNPIDQHALESLVHSYHNLMAYPKMQESDIKLHAWFYELETATLKGYKAQTNEFVDL